MKKSKGMAVGDVVRIKRSPGGWSQEVSILLFEGGKLCSATRSRVGSLATVIGFDVDTDPIVKEENRELVDLLLEDGRVIQTEKRFWEVVP